MQTLWYAVPIVLVQSRLWSILIQTIIYYALFFSLISTFPLSLYVGPFNRVLNRFSSNSLLKETKAKKQRESFSVLHSMPHMHASLWPHILDIAGTWCQCVCALHSCTQMAILLCPHHLKEVFPQGHHLSPLTAATILEQSPALASGTTDFLADPSFSSQLPHLLSEIASVDHIHQFYSTSSLQAPHPI